MTETVNDLVELLKAYAKQETVGPLQRLGRYLGFGLGGSVVIATGCILLLLGLLRVLQTETGSTFTGSWSWAPYAITLVGRADRRRDLLELHQAVEGEAEMSAAATAPPISRADIEAKLRELQGGATHARRRGRDDRTAVGIGVAIVDRRRRPSSIGRRKGRSQTTIVEIRRI